MIKIGIIGDIGSGKSYVAKNFGYPVFNADAEVGKLYKKEKKIFNKLKKVLPKYIHSFPVNKNEISNAILANKFNLKKIIKIVHLEIRKKMNIFLKKNKNKKIIILDIPLLLENKINKKNDVLIFVKSKKSDILKRLSKRENFNPKLLNTFKNIQLPLDYKKEKSQFVIKNYFNN
jgi:dephospho-CoA kinase